MGRLFSANGAKALGPGHRPGFYCSENGGLKGREMVQADAIIP